MATRIEKVECWVLRAPIAEPVANAFGAMTNRPAVFLRVAASDGAWGWGEVFSNFPQVGAEHRARLVDSIFAPLLAGIAADDPAPVRALLEERTRRMAIQCGEPGPFAQIAGAVDQALWDIAARRAGVPLWKHLGGRNRVRVYASGIGPEHVVETALAKRAEGYRAFKLKVGFGSERDVANLAAMRAALGDAATIMCDANQAWTVEDAPARIAELAPHRPLWIEEPLAADHPHAAWRTLAGGSAIPLAAGENLRGQEAFDDAIAAGYLKYVQPDVGKWGGISGGLAVARHAARRDLAYCPHWLAGGVGLAASMHALAGSGNTLGYAEVDANPNPLREDVYPFAIVDGWVTLSDAPGLGVEPDLGRLGKYVVPR
ncbi:MAG: mandelate racemase/muconate lactonizing enzyme family protein [Burkholderiales bacterium]|nr:mandelate racemase/muconate lactonizing enzyme family protein [Burkholderiales bacterium]